MNMRFLSIAVSIVMLVALAMAISSVVVYAKVERTYYLSGGDAVVYHRYGLTTNGFGWLQSVKNVMIPDTITVCARLHTGFSYSDVYPVIDHGINYGVNWAIEAIPQYNYRIRVAFGDGEVSVDVPGEFQVPHMYCFRVRSDSSGYYLDVFVDGQLYSSVGPRSYAMVTGWYNPIYIGVYSDFSKFGEYTTITLFLLFNRPLSDFEIAGIAKGIIPHDGLLVYFDPTVWHYYLDVFVDLSGNGNNFMVCNPLTAYTDYTNMFVIRGRYRDNYVHFQYFPWFSRIEIYDPNGGLVSRFTVADVDNGYGEVIDYPIYLRAGEYTIVYYDPNEGVTTTVTAVETVIYTTTAAVVETQTVTQITIINYTTTSTVAVPVVSYRTVTTATTVYAATGVRWDWVVVVLMIMVLGVSSIYLYTKLRS